MYSRIWKDLEPVLNVNGMHGVKLYSETEGEIVHLKLEPGAHLKAHKTPVNVLFYVLEGEATLHIGDEVATYPKDSTVDSPKDIPHAVTNNGKVDLRLLVIKMPKPYIKRSKNMSMFCYQCQETSRNLGCTMRGVCGKSPELCHFMDLSIHAMKAWPTFPNVCWRKASITRKTVFS
jgi:mannose-6-phosphate isomerase-like protein (cupin superfamily)